MTRRVSPAGKSRTKAAPATTSDAPSSTPRRARARKVAPAPEPAPEAAAVVEPHFTIPAMAQAARRRGLFFAGAFALVAVGAAASVFQAVQASGRHHSGSRPTPGAPPPAAAVATAEAAVPILADYSPPDRDQVRRAWSDVAHAYGGEGLSGVLRLDMDCFARLKQAPSYATLDYCVAFDAFADAAQKELMGSAPPSPGSWFAQGPERQLAAARTLVGQDGDPAVRLLDLRRLAGEVSQEHPGARPPQRDAALIVPVATPDEAPPTRIPARVVKVSDVTPPAPRAEPPKPELPRPAPARTVIKPAPVKAATARAATVKAVTPKPSPPHPAKTAPAPVEPRHAAHRGEASHGHAPERHAAHPQTHAQFHPPAPPARPGGLRGFLVRTFDAVTGRHPKATPPVRPRRAPSGARLQLASTSGRRETEGTPWIDCRHPATAEARRICTAVEDDQAQRDFQRDLSQTHVRRGDSSR